MKVDMRNGRTAITLTKSNVSRLLEARYIVDAIARNTEGDAAGRAAAAASELQSLAERYGANHLEVDGTLKMTEAEKARYGM